MATPSPSFIRRSRLATFTYFSDTLYFNKTINNERFYSEVARPGFSQFNIQVEKELHGFLIDSYSTDITVTSEELINYLQIARQVIIEKRPYSRMIKLKQTYKIAYEESIKITNIKMTKEKLSEMESYEVQNLLDNQDRLCTIYTKINEDLKKYKEEIINPLLEKFIQYSNIILMNLNIVIQNLQQELESVNICLSEKDFETHCTTIKKLKDGQCCICQEDFKDDELLTKINICGHVGHKECFHTYLTEKCKKPKCPICRSNILPENNQTTIQLPENNQTTARLSDVADNINLFEMPPILPRIEMPPFEENIVPANTAGTLEHLLNFPTTRAARIHSASENEARIEARTRAEHSVRNITIVEMDNILNSEPPIVNITIRQPPNTTLVNMSVDNMSVDSVDDAIPDLD